MALQVGKPIQIDRVNLMLRNVVAMQAGVEAIGHGCMSDQKTLELMVELANVPNRRPIRGRFGHPGVSENATGKQVMVSGNFRIATDSRGTFLVHDARLLKAARKSPAFGKDPIEYIFTIAETDPAEFAESVIIDAYYVWTRRNEAGEVVDVPVWVKNEDGDWYRNARPDDALTDLPVLRPVTFYYCDFVNEGALTHHGLFSMGSAGPGNVFAGHSAAYARELFDLVDRWRAAYQVPLEALPAKVDVMMQKYLASRKDKVVMKALGAQATDLLDEMFEEGDELITPKTPNDAKTDAALEKSQQALKVAEQLAANLSAGESDLQGRSRFATTEELAALQATVDAQGERIRELTGQLRKATELLARSMNSMATMQRNLLRMDGEPVVGAPVAMNGNSGNALEPMGFGLLPPSSVPATPRVVLRRRRRSSGRLKRSNGARKRSNASFFFCPPVLGGGLPFYSSRCRS